MLQTKLFEIRDRHTLIPVMVTKFPVAHDNPAEAFLLGRAGFRGMNDFSLTRLADGGMTTRYEPFGWREDGTRTLFEAHRHIEKNFDALNSGDVIDVEFLLGETPAPKPSERAA